MIHDLRLRRMSVSELNAKLESEKIAIIDLLNFEDGVTSVGIPGAIRINPIRLRGRSKVIIPRELELILYCSSVGRDNKRSGGSRSPGGREFRRFGYWKAD